MKFLFPTIGEFRQFAAAKRFLGTGEELAKSGHEVWLAVMKSAENEKRLALEAPHCKVVYYSQGNIVREILSKLRIVWSLRPDVVYAASYTPRTLAFLRFLFPRKTKSVIEFNELYSAYSGRGPWRLSEYIACRENDGILCASKVLEAHFRDVCERHHLHRQICYSPYAYPEHLAKRCGDPVKPPVVLFMASLWKAYGIYDVIDACLEVMGRGTEMVLEVLGGGPEKDAVTELVKQKGLEQKIRIRGYVAEEELNAYFSTASVFVAPLKDNFQDRARCPSKLYFYIPFNKPIVTCKFGDPYDALQEYGFYYQSGDTHDMASAIEKALVASETFGYPEGFIERHSWRARAAQLQDWVLSWGK